MLLVCCLFLSCAEKKKIRGHPLWTRTGIALRLYIGDTRKLPATLDVLFERNTNGLFYMAPDWKPEALIDSWGTPLRYIKRENLEFDLKSAGPDKQFETDDDIVL